MKKQSNLKKYDASKFSDWLNAPFIQGELKKQIIEMSPFEKKSAFSPTQLNFGTAGIRAKMGPGTHYLNKFVYQQLMIGYCKYILGNKKVNPSIVIGHDNRMYSEYFATICAKVALGMGINVYLFENNKLMPTPIISYTIRRLKCDGGVNITASHNPKNDNGFKVYNNHGAQILPDDAEKIIKYLPKSKDILNLCIPTTQEKPKYISYDGITQEYFNSIINACCINKNFLKPNCLLKKLPIVFSGFHGTTTELIPKFLFHLGFKKIYWYPQHSTISSLFENCPISNPEDERAFDDIKKFADSKKATIIIGCDPDGDRMTIGFKKTNRWRFLNGNELGVVFTYYILSHKKFHNNPYILSTHVSTGYIDKIASKYNAKVIRSDVGFKWIGNLIDKQKGDFVVGFEEAIGSLTHTICRDKDSFGATYLALEILDNISKYYIDLHDYLQGEIFDKFGPSFSISLSYKIYSSDWKKDAQIMLSRALKFKQKEIFDYKIEKISFDKKTNIVSWILDKHSWIKFRLSGTEPKFKVYLYLNDQVYGQLRSASIQHAGLIENTILKGFKYTK